jgi:hypothetical protein
LLQTITIDGHGLEFSLQTISLGDNVWCRGQDTFLAIQDIVDFGFDPVA